MYAGSGVSDYGVVIVGAGLYGIQAARYYLEIHPEANICILESDSVIGGTWSSKRIYDAFWTQTPIGMAEFSDRPMSPPPLEDQYYGFFPARYVTEYLEAYANDHIYNNVTLRDRIKFNVHVENIDRIDASWIISCQGNVKLRTARLIDATGMTSSPNVPDLPGRKDFQGRILHHKDFGQLGNLEEVKGHRFAVFGGGKSAADVAYAAAKAGKHVSWIIREAGNGPAAFLSAKGRGPYGNSNESFYTRFVASFLPNPFCKDRYLSRLLHGTLLGSWIVGRVWNAIDRGHRRKVDYHRAEGKKTGFNKLEPDTPLFWQNDSSGINQRGDFYSTIASKVHVYRNDIKQVSADAIKLAPRIEGREHGEVLPVDIIVLCTGWNPISSLYSPTFAEMMGLPVALDNIGGTLEMEEKLMQSPNLTDDHFLSLRDRPRYRREMPLHTPFRLYRAMVPILEDDAQSILFLGKLVVGNNFRVAEVQGLWAVAYLDGHLPPGKFDMQQDIDETVSWCQRRYLNKGALGSWFFFDALDYTDMLLAQLGIRSHRQKGWWKSFFGPCMAMDLKNLVAEYKVRCQP